MDTENLKLLTSRRQEILQEIKDLKQSLSNLDEDLLQAVGNDQINSFFGPEVGKKDYGEVTFTNNGVKLTLKKTRRVKLDNDQMIEAGRGLSWEALNKFFKVKFDMGEKEYEALQAAAMDSETYSDVLSMVDEAREVIIGDVTITNAIIEE